MIAREPASATTVVPEWSLATRVAFRFAFAYVLLFFASFAAFFAPLTLPLALVSRVFWSGVAPFVAEHVMNVAPPPLVSDSDGLTQWMMFLGSALAAALVTVIWSIADRHRKNYVTLNAWLRVIARYALGVAMVSYGLAKILHLQMLPPHLAKLVQPLGESSPTSLLWITMGSSAAYSAFTGAVEALGGVLLFNRRTATLGALVSFAAMAHVVAMNLAFDVSVKVWSMNLLALSALLFVPDLPRLARVFAFNRPTEPVVFPPLFRRARTERIAFRVGMVCLAITLGLRVFAMASLRARSHGSTPVPIYGIYDVESFTSNGVPVPPSLTEEARWRTVVIERSGLASIRLMNDDALDYLTRVDTLAGTVTFVANPDTTLTTAGATRLAYDPRLIESRFGPALEADVRAAHTLQFARPQPGGLSLRGRWDGDSIEVRLTRVDESEFLLLGRGFHWVQYHPFFR